MLTIHLAATLSLFVAQSFDDATADAALRARVIPTAVERWQTIPWRTDLEEARREATRDGKLLFMWSMNGHPVGCT